MTSEPAGSLVVNISHHPICACIWGGSKTVYVGVGGRSLEDQDPPPPFRGTGTPMLYIGGKCCATTTVHVV